MSTATKPNQKTLDGWIDEYQKHGCRLDAYLAHFSSLPREAIEQAIREAAEGKDCEIHPHQYHVGKARLATMAGNLLMDVKSIEGCAEFDALHNLIAERAEAIDGFGALAIYDTALRLAFYLGEDRHPKDVYLHAGARAGWRQFREWGLITADAHNDKLKMVDLPELSRLGKACHIENFLCIFKDGKSEDCDPRDCDPCKVCSD